MLCFLFCVPLALCQKNLYISTAVSLFGPPLEENGKSWRYDFKGQYATTIYKDTPYSYSYTQLGYDFPDSTAMLVSRLPTGAHNYRIDYRIRLHKSEFPNSKPNGGMAFFLSKDPSIKEGSAFGVAEEFDGALVVLDLKGDNGRPFIGAVVKDGIKYDPKTRGSDIMKRVLVDEHLLDKDDQFIVRLEQERNVLKISLVKGKKETQVMALTSDTLGKDCYVGIAGSQEGGPLLFRLYGIRFYTTMTSPNKQGRDEAPKKKTGKLIWIMLLLIACGIGYYLFTNYKKYK